MCMLTASYPTRALQAWEKKIGMLLVSELLLANSSSGNRDGVGFGNTEGMYIKWEEPASNIVFTDEYNAALQQLITAPLIAHVRAISTGVGAKEGAHPFKVGNIMLMHNGTFTNYRKFLAKYQESIGDKNPVDSHVVTYMLAEAVGDGYLNQDHIQTTLESTIGSFALLITDAATGNLWVVAGSNPLYVQHSGPLWLVNTSKINLDNLGSSIEGVAKLLYSKSWEVGETKRIDEFTVNLLTRKGLTKVHKLDKKKHMVTYNQQFRGGTTHHYQGAVKPISSDEARSRAEWADLIIHLPYMNRLELTLGCFVLLETEWWKAELECLEVLHATLSQIDTDFGSPVKKELWGELMSMTNQNAYAIIASYTDIAFPYILNSVEDLRRFTVDIRRDLEAGRCFH